MPLRGGFSGCLPCGGVEVMAKDTWSRVRRKSKRSIQNVEAEVVRSFLEAPLDLHESESTPRVVSRGTSVQSFLDFCRAEGPATSSRAVSVQSLLSSDEASQQKHEALAQDSVQMALTFTAADDGRNSGTLMSDPASNLSSHRSCEQAALEKPKVDIADTSRPPSPMPTPVDIADSASGSEYRASPAALQQQKRQDAAACLPTQPGPFLASQSFREHSSATLPPPEKPTLLTSKHFEKQVLETPKVYDQPGPESTILLGAPPVMPVKVPSAQMLSTARSAPPTAYELPARAASQTLLASTRTVGTYLDPAAQTPAAARHISRDLDMQTATAAQSLTSKTFDVARLASRLAGRWAVEAGGALAASTQEASVSAAGMLADATRKVDSSITSYVHQAWGRIAERVNEEGETDSESSSDGGEDSPARAAIGAHGHSQVHPAGYSNIACPAAGQPQAAHLAGQHPRSASFSIPAADYAGGVPGTLFAASYKAGSPAPKVTGQQVMQASLARQPLQRGNTFSLGTMDPHFQPGHHGFSHAGIPAQQLHSFIQAAPLLQR
mmetsp:Transcript_72259/g.211743  ORF Transcript_72259/g.211743 Transcript_72259/m.211743 type:complete len:553 (+) Transcript_72259:65-1723(+)